MVTSGINTSIFSILTWLSPRWLGSIPGNGNTLIERQDLPGGSEGRAMSIEHLLLIYNLSKMAKYDELVASADGYDSDDSGADTDEEVITR